MDKTEIKLLLLVVLYNKSLHSSETLASLLQLKEQLGGSRLLIWDNSPKPVMQEDEVQIIKESFADVEFVNTTENLALSSIYNNVIQRPDLLEFDAVTLLDHDSILADNFFTEAKKSLLQHPAINLFLPIVESNNEIVSPANLYFFKGVRWKEKYKGILSTKWRAAINSGMVIRVPYLMQEFAGYDERLKFYGTDTYFMNCYASQNERLYVLDTHIKHQLNYFEAEALDTKLRRFHEIRRSTAILNERPLWLRLATKAYLMGFTLLQAVRFKSTRFIYDHKR